MALQHARFLETVDLIAPGPIGSTSVSSSLLKTRQIQVMRLVLPAGEGMPSHQVAGDITIHCLSGEASLTTAQGEHRLKPGQLIALPGHEPHAVHAHAASVLLVTVVRIPSPDAQDASPDTQGGTP